MCVYTGESSRFKERPIFTPQPRALRLGARFIKSIKIIGWTAGILLACWLIIFTCTLFIQDKLVFQARHLPADHAFHFDESFREHVLKTRDGETLSVLHFLSGSSKGLILYFHGNAGNLQRWGEYANDFTSLGYDVVMPDYRGYGKSTGAPSETTLYEDARTVKAWTDSIPHKRLIIYGRSLGTGVATNLAADIDADLLILETPFYELKDAVNAWLKPFVHLKYEFPNYRNLPRVKCRKIIIQGTDDAIVPFSSAIKLKPLLGPDDEFVVIEGAAHNNLTDFELYHRTLRKLLQ
jgi:pimeloyl-ACP methyl ester carboxylesterase